MRCDRLAALLLLGLLAVSPSLAEQTQGVQWLGDYGKMLKEAKVLEKASGNIQQIFPIFFINFTKSTAIPEL